MYDKIVAVTVILSSYTELNPSSFKIPVWKVCYGLFTLNVCGCININIGVNFNIVLMVTQMLILVYKLYATQNILIFQDLFACHIHGRNGWTPPIHTFFKFSCRDLFLCLIMEPHVSMLFIITGTCFLVLCNCCHKIVQCSDPSVVSVQALL